MNFKELNMPMLRKMISLALLSIASFAFANPDPLTLWVMPNGVSPQETLEQRLEQFTQQTGIPTQIQILDWREAWNRIATALANKENLPDVLQLGTTWIPYFASLHQIKPLTPWLDKIDSNRFAPVSWNTTHIDSDSIIYSIPWFIDVRALLANKRILQKNKINKEDLTTYDGFVSAIRKINNSKDFLENGVKIRGFAIPGKSDWNIPHNFAPWIWSNGGDFLAKDSLGKWHANILNEKTLTGIAKYLSFVLDTLVPTDMIQTNTAEVAQSFNAGELAFIVNTAEIITQTRFEGEKGGLSNAQIGSDGVAVLPFPMGNEGSINFIGGSNLAIPATNNRPEALDLLLFLTNDETQDIYTKQIGFLPTSKDILKKRAEDEDYIQLIKALETGKTYTTIPEWGVIEQDLVAMFSAIWEHLEIPALYSEDKIYQIFSTHTQAIDKQLGYTATGAMTFAEFQEIWHKNIISNQDESSSIRENEYVSENLRKAPWVFIVMVFLGFLFSLKRKKK